MERNALRPKLAGCRHCRDLIERPLYNAGQPSRCEGLLRIVVPPFSAGASLTLTDPFRSVEFPDSRPSTNERAGVNREARPRLRDDLGWIVNAQSSA